jgi:hypothetical protein
MKIHEKAVFDSSENYTSASDMLYFSMAMVPALIATNSVIRLPKNSDFTMTLRM